MDAGAAVLHPVGFEQVRLLGGTPPRFKRLVGICPCDRSEPFPIFVVSVRNPLQSV